MVDFDRDFYGAAVSWRDVRRFDSGVLRTTVGLDYDRSSDDRKGFENFAGSQLGVRGALKRELGRGSLKAAELAAAAMIRRHSLELNEFEQSQLKQALMRAGLDVSSAIEARLSGDFNFEPRDGLLRRPGTRPPAAPSRRATTPAWSMRSKQNVDRRDLSLATAQSCPLAPLFACQEPREPVQHERETAASPQPP